MDISFKSRKLQKLCSSMESMSKGVGKRRASRLAQRLQEMQSADQLADLATLPQTRCHELAGERKGLLSVDLDNPCRLIFEPVIKPPPKRLDGGLDWEAITSVIIVEIVENQ